MKNQNHVAFHYCMYHLQKQLWQQQTYLFHERGKQRNDPKPYWTSWLYRTPDPVLTHYFPIDAEEFHGISNGWWKHHEQAHICKPQQQHIESCKLCVKQAVHSKKYAMTLQAKPRSARAQAKPALGFNAIPHEQGRNDFKWHRGQQASLAPPCSNLRTSGVASLKFGEAKILGIQTVWF